MGADPFVRNLQPNTARGGRLHTVVPCKRTTSRSGRPVARTPPHAALWAATALPLRGSHRAPLVDQHLYMHTRAPPLRGSSTM